MKEEVCSECQNTNGEHKRGCKYFPGRHGNIQHTKRGFAIHEFTDRNGVKCSLQKSSLATDDCIWLGCAEIGLKRFEPFIGWSDVPLENRGPNGINYIANTRMHLTREQVKELLPILQRFVKTGELDVPSGHYR